MATGRIALTAAGTMTAPSVDSFSYTGRGYVFTTPGHGRINLLLLLWCATRNEEYRRLVFGHAHIVDPGAALLGRLVICAILLGPSFSLRIVHFAEWEIHNPFFKAEPTHPTEVPSHFPYCASQDIGRYSNPFIPWALLGWACPFLAPTP